MRDRDSIILENLYSGILLNENSDEEYLRLAQDPEKNKEELQRMVDVAFLKKDIPWGEREVSTNASGKIKKIMYRAIDSSRPGDMALGVGKYFSNLEEKAKLYGSDVRKFYVEANVVGSNSPEFELIKNRALKTITPDEGIPEAITRLAKEDGYQGVHGGGIFGTVIFNKQNYTSADPVIYDDQGNVIPLSQRFDSSKDDIRH